MIYYETGQTARAYSSGLSPADVRAMTRAQAPTLCPEVLLPSLPETQSFDDFRSHNAESLGAAVPYWAIAWPGGQALARYLLDNPDLVRGQSIIDLGCGSGLVAASAMRAGAARALALDADPHALSAVAETGRLNGVEISTLLDSFEAFEPEDGAIVCAGDLWYEREIARRATQALRRVAAAGHQVFCGDPGRPGRPRIGLEELAAYSMTTSEAFERAATLCCRVFALRP